MATSVCQVSGVLTWPVVSHARKTLRTAVSYSTISSPKRNVNSRLLCVAGNDCFGLPPTAGLKRRLRRHRMSVRAGSEGPTAKEDETTMQIKAPDNFEAPKELKLFTPRGDQWFALLTGALAPLFRLGMGLFTLGYTVGLEKASPEKYAVIRLFGYAIKEEGTLVKGLPRPEKPLELYEFEGCPFCRKVREMVTVLDLDVLYYPCPQRGPTFRPKAMAMGGKRQFPYMVDPNTGVAMYESDAIIKYLADTYGNGTVPLMLRLGPITSITAGFAMLARGGKGSGYVPAKMPPQPLEVWAYESSPFCKVVREALCELELPFLYHSTGRGSPKRQEIFEQMGVFQVPYLEDPNTGVKMHESAAIVDYLYATYALPKEKAA